MISGCLPAKGCFHLLMIIGMTLTPLTGCAGTAWDHPIRGQAGLQQDTEACERQAGQSLSAMDPHTGNALTLREGIEECLRERGYVQRPSENKK